MEEIEIYCLDNSELASFEAFHKEYRSDIYVKAHENYFNVFIFTILRLQQDFESATEYSGFYIAEPNIILVREVSSSEIKFVLAQLYLRNYFERIKPISSEEVDKLQSTFFKL